jgi:uncharacterized protein (UPF0332 family)
MPDGRCPSAAQLNLDDGDYVASINRAYYAIFYAANALLSLDDEQRSKHSHVMGLFRQKYVKTGLIEKEYSDLYGDAFDARIESDYDLRLFPEKDLVEKALQAAHRFVTRIEQLFSEKK